MKLSSFLAAAAAAISATAAALPYEEANVANGETYFKKLHLTGLPCWAPEIHVTNKFIPELELVVPYYAETTQGFQKKAIERCRSSPDCENIYIMSELWYAYFYKGPPTTKRDFDWRKARCDAGTRDTVAFSKRIKREFS
ncbi:hypothetical protein CDD80_1319 [Ophiocordyceps camponoti-rufipedis]|uniref:Uncharacterized protein n=1 Tax=Ophiocordyceps camponoti-rufipedis TaxID=2004952 RepID=A0A2C5ZBX3_9HYPO|nr:hypothetical protein CDD80_1319 [Ophiocordyceps camponoti-rufipedis]